jgi:mersacidin/lichenicidin family type 2 lantibiotic
MSVSNIIRAWKDDEYLASLTPADRAMLPANPAGVAEVRDAFRPQDPAYSLTCTKLECSNYISCQRHCF